MRPMLSRMSRTLACALGLAGVAHAANPNWPNGVNDDPRLEYPDDPSYINVDANGKVTGGEWNFWSFVPYEWADNKNFRQVEVALGTGIHADRAWQHTIGDRRVMVAVLDSGIEWDHPDLQMKHYLSRSELKGCLPAPLDAPPEGADEYDVNGDGIFNIADYLAKDPAFGPARDALGNKNGLLDPGDLIRTCSDGVDDDANGFTDDISGWDAYRGDNDPYDDTRYGHGTGEARDSVGAGNNGIGGIGVCPECTLLNVRVGDSFVVDVNEFATGVIFAVDSGATVVQEALGAVNNSAYAQSAIEYAYRNNVVIIASAADELSFHHNMPGTNNHTVYVHAIVHDDGDAKDSTTFLNFNNCTNFGAQLLLSTPGGGCSSEAVGITSGHAGLIYSAALEKGVNPPLSSEEVRGLLIMSADDIDVPESATDDTKFPSGKGWDLHFGYGRNNARRSLDFIYDEVIPPEADIVAPLWFEPINVRERKTVDVTGRVGARIDGLPARYSDYTWTLEWAIGVDPKGGWTTIKTGTGTVGGGTTPGVLATWDVEAASKAIDFTKKLVDAHQWTFTLRLRVEATSNGKPVKSEFRKAGHFISDPDLHEGWPKNLNTSAEGSPKIFDIDGDGPEEVIVATTDGYIHAFKLDGSEAAGFPIALPFRREMDPTYAFNITDICAFRPEGEKGDCGPVGQVDPTLPRQTLMLGIGVGALTGTEALSIVVATYDGFVYVYGTDGKLADGWPQKIDQEWFRNTDPDHLKDDGYFGAPVLYDLDGNGDLEIIAAGMDAQLYVWHHDGKPVDGFPVLVRDPLEDELAHIIVTPAVGDIDNDGYPEIVVGTNEVYGGNEGRAYAIRHTGASAPDKIEEALEDGWPVTLNGVAVNVLPLVGRGSPANPVLADLDGDGTLEANIDSIGYFPSFYKADGSKYLRPNQDGNLADVNNADFGKFSDSEDTPAFVLINSGTFADLDKKGGLDFFKGTAGFDFALAFAEGGKRAVFDHQVGGWDTDTFRFIDGFPRKIEDWQFFMNPTAVDIDGDGWVNLLNGSGGYLVHAWNYRGDQPPGWPKNTGGWIIASPSAGDLDGDGKWDIFNSTRNGWMFAWKATGGVGKDDIEWQTYSHDFHNTNNYEEPKARYNKYPETSDGTDAVDGADVTDGSDAVDGSDATDAADGSDAADAADGSDATDAADGADAADATDGATEASDSTDGVAPAASSDDGCTTGAGSVNAPMWAFLLLGVFGLLRRLRRA